MHRVAVFLIVMAMGGVVLWLGFTEPAAAAITMVTVAGSVEIASHLTTPQPAPVARILVIVLVCVIVVFLLHRRYDPTLAVTYTLGAAVLAGEIARRFTGIGYRVPRLVF